LGLCDVTRSNASEEVPASINRKPRAVNETLRNRRHLGLVFNDQHEGSGSLTAPPRRGRGQGHDGCLITMGQREAEESLPFRTILGLRGSPVSLHDAAADGQPRPPPGTPACVPRQNFSKTRFSVPWGRPGPRSDTSMTSTPSLWRARITSGLPAGVYFDALSSTFTITCSRSTGSANAKRQVRRHVHLDGSPRELSFETRQSRAEDLLQWHHSRFTLETPGLQTGHVQ